MVDTPLATSNTRCYGREAPPLEYTKDLITQDVHFQSCALHWRGGGKWEDWTPVFMDIPRLGPYLTVGQPIGWPVFWGSSRPPVAWRSSTAPTPSLSPGLSTTTVPPTNAPPSLCVKSDLTIVSNTDTTPTVNCPICKVQHNWEVGSRTTVLFTTTTLHNVFLDPGFRLPFHIDIESICGGRTSELCRAWKFGYTNVTRPQDIIVLAGLNNVVNQHNAGGEASGFHSLLKLWNYEVEQRNPTSTFRACRILSR